MEEDLAGSDRLSASVARSARSASKMDHGNQISADSRLPKNLEHGRHLWRHASRAM